MRLTLASTSSTRRKLLQDAGLTFDAIPAEVEEAPVKADLLRQGRTPAQIAQTLAELKAVEASRRTAGLVIGADQTLDLDGRLYDKPSDMAETRRHLLAFRGRSHQLHAAAVLAANGVVLARVQDTASLHVRAFSDAFLDAYLDREGASLLGCVGGYRLEGEGAQLFERIEGAYFTVLGLPLLGVLAALRSLGALAA